MHVTLEQLESFHKYAAEEIAKSDAEISWAALFQTWRKESPVAAEHAESNDALREGIEEVDTGGAKSVDEFMAEIRRQLGLEKA